LRPLRLFFATFAIKGFSLVQGQKPLPAKYANEDPESTQRKARKAKFNNLGEIT
jgi:hypothetical protein